MANVLIDLDNTLTKVEPIIKKMASVFGKEIKSSDELQSYTIGTLFGLTEEEDKKFWNLFGYQVIEESEPNSVLIEKIYLELVKPEDKVYIITARPESQRNITNKWVKKFGLYHTEDVILTGKNSKVPLIESLGIDVIIDDNPKLFEEIEVVKDLFPNSNISKIIKDKSIQRYVVDYGYNKDVISEFRIDRKTGEITNGNEN